MAIKYKHLPEKAIYLRTQHHMTLEEIMERLSLPRTTVYYWIKDIPIPRTEKQSEAQRERGKKVRAKYAALREQAYQLGIEQSTELFQHQTFGDFVVLYMAEDYKRNRNMASFVNSDPLMVKLAHGWMTKVTPKKPDYSLQYHADHDVDELKVYWVNVLGIEPELIKAMRKSNSNELSGRQFRSVCGLLAVAVSDTYFRSRLEAWMDIVKSEW